MSGKTTLSFDEASKSSERFRLVYSAGNRIKEIIQGHTGILNSIIFALSKEENQFMEYQYPERTVQRRLEYDRIFPLETVRIEGFKDRHEADVETAKIHTGPYADELARSMNALAVSIATDIYFRNSAYKPESEEGRKLLAHELTHVAQYEEGRITGAVEQKELEEEAGEAEAQEGYNPDPMVAVEVDGEIFRFRRSRMKRIASEVARNLESWFEQQKAFLSEKDYLNFLCKVEKWIKRYKNA